MKRQFFAVVAAVCFLVSCSSGDGAPASKTPNADQAEALARKVATAKSAVFNELSLPTADEIGAVFRDQGLWGQYLVTDSTSAVPLILRTWRDVCSGFNFDEVIRAYTPTNSISKSYVPNFEGVSDEERATNPKYGVMTISIFDIGDSPTINPYNMVMDRFALQEGSCNVKIRLGYGDCPLTSKDRPSGISLPVNEFGWTENQAVADFNPKCKKPTSDQIEGVATYSAIESNYISDGFKIVVRSATPKGAQGGVFARTTYFYPQKDLGLLFVIELSHQDGTMNKSEYAQLVSSNSSLSQSLVESTFTTWSNKLFTNVKLSEIASDAPSTGSGNSSTGTATMQKPTWITGVNPFADYNEAPFVQTACDIFRQDIPDAIGKDAVLRTAVDTLRKLEETYGLDAKEAAKNENLTYQEIWGGVSALIRYYDDYSTDFRLPASFSMTEGSCSDYGFTIENEKFSSRNGGWSSVEN